MQYLIVNADDFGRNPGISRGIVEAHLHGIVTSTTVLMNCEDAPRSLEIAFGKAPELKIGVHLNLTYGKPLSISSKISTLIDEDGLFRSPNEAWHVLLGWNKDDLYTELTTQIERFIHTTGFMPTHLDAHYHSALLFPNALTVMLDLANKYSVPIRRPPVLEPIDNALAVLIQCFPNIEPVMAKEIINESKHIISRNTTVNWPDRLELSFSRPNITPENIELIISHLPHGVTELMCHPGYGDTTSIPAYRIERENELGILTNANIVKMIADQNIRLISFNELQPISSE